MIATSLLPVLKAAYPGASIGFVIASWAAAVVKNHPLVDYVHIVDHKIMNRQLTGRAKVLRYRETRKLALHEMRRVSYDLAICLHPWRPDLLRLAWQARIPNRVAFSNSILGPLATHLAEYPEENTLIPHGQALTRLLSCLGIGEEAIKLRRASLAQSTPKSLQEVEQLLSVASLAHSTYIVFHIGSGVRAKELPNSFWRELVQSLSPNIQIIFTGKSAAEQANIREVTQGLPNCIDASSKLSWDGFVAAIRHAQVLYTVDTVAGHVAAAVSTACVAMFGGNNGVGRWRPDGESVTVWSHAMECAPCRNMHGCANMKCMQGFVPAVILALSPLPPALGSKISKAECDDLVQEST